MAPAVTSRTVVSYTAFPPLPGIWHCLFPGGISLLHYPWSRLHRTLSGILPCEARTFLTCSQRLQPRSFILLSIFSIYHTMLLRSKASVPLMLTDFFAFHVHEILKTFEIRTFFCEKWLISHVLWVPKPSIFMQARK